MHGMPESTTSLSCASLVSVYQSDAVELDDGGADVDHVGPRVFLQDLEQPLRRDDVVLLVRSPVDPSNLCVGADNYFAGRNRILPVIGARQIGLDDPDVGMQSSQDRGVDGVFVDSNNVSVLACLETRDQVLADETGRASNGDAWRHPLPLSDLQPMEDEARQVSDDYHDRPPEPGRIDDRPATIDRSLDVRCDPLRCRP